MYRRTTYLITGRVPLGGMHSSLGHLGVLFPYSSARADLSHLQRNTYLPYTLIPSAARINYQPGPLLLRLQTHLHRRRYDPRKYDRQRRSSDLVCRVSNRIVLVVVLGWKRKMGMIAAL